MHAGEDATPREASQSPPHPDNWPSDLHDFGSAFDSLNLSTVPSNVRIEQVPQDGGQQIKEMLRHAAQENRFADIPASLAGSAGALEALAPLLQPRSSQHEQRIGRPGALCCRGSCLPVKASVCCVQMEQPGQLKWTCCQV